MGGSGWWEEEVVLVVGGRGGETKGSGCGRWVREGEEEECVCVEREAGNGREEKVKLLG